MSTAPANDPEIIQLRAEVTAIEAAMQEVAQDALRVHKQAGQPLVTWQEGRVVWIPADQIPADVATPRH